MAYVNVAGWTNEQVTDWLKGIDSSICVYVDSFQKKDVTGQELLNFRPDDLEILGVKKIGHQEIILEGVEHLRNIHYELDRENLQLLAMKLSVLARNLHNELCHSHSESQLLSTQTLADIANIVTCAKPLITWLDRPGFCGDPNYEERRSRILSLALRMATCGQRDRFAENPVVDMKDGSAEMAKEAESIVQEITDPLILQPASLDLATIKKRSSDDLGFYIVPSFKGVHKISELKLNSPAHQSGKIEPGDEIVQINYQTVVGWDVKHVMTLFTECPTEVLLTLKKRPRHTKVYGQIYVKPYRLPSKKRASHNHPFARRPELLTQLPLRLTLHKVPMATAKKETNKRDSRCSSSSDEEVSVQHNLVVPSKPVHRRATITGASPLSKRPPINIHDLWHLQLEKDSDIKQSSTSVIDFEERVLSSSKAQSSSKTSDIQEKESHEPARTKDLAQNQESLSIKEKIKLFSNNPEKSEPANPPPIKTRPQIRLNSQPLFFESTEVGEEVEKDHLRPTKSEEVDTTEHGRVVVTINSLFDKTTENEEAYKIGKMLESLSNSLPSSARFRKGIIIGETSTPLTTQSLPIRRGCGKNKELAEMCQSPNPLPAVKPKVLKSPGPIPSQTLPKAAPRISTEQLRGRVSSVTPPPAPVPPPRPSVQTSKSSGRACYRAIMAAKSIGKGSQKTNRNKTQAPPKTRNIGVKDCPQHLDCQGWLLQRCRKGSGMWKKRWCLVFDNTIYTFTSKLGAKAETMVFLPGFTVSRADEVKSRPFAFKIYHTGTTFYFSAETQFELTVWMDALSTATLAQNSNCQEVIFSESEEEAKEVDGALSSQRVLSKKPTPVPRPAQAPSAPPPPAFATSESSKKFGSLKKLGSGRSSLDRKYLRMFGVSEAPVPVPTAQYRSYRRVHNTLPPPPPPSQSAHNKSNAEPPRHHPCNSNHPPEMGDYRLACLTAKTTPPVPRRRLVEGRSVDPPPRPQISAPIALNSPMPENLMERPTISRPNNERRESGNRAEGFLASSLRRGEYQNRKKKKKIQPFVFENTDLGLMYVETPGRNRTMDDSHILNSPDYPGLVYPPVFEPGTYTLDTNAILPRLTRHQPHN